MTIKHQNRFSKNLDYINMSKQSQKLFVYRNISIFENSESRSLNVNQNAPKVYHPKSEVSKTTTLLPTASSDDGNDLEPCCRYCWRSEK